jgi:hypothetical protein
MESRESSTGTEHNWLGPGPRKGLEPPGLLFSASSLLGTPPPHTALLSSQSLQWQLLEAVAAAAALPKEVYGLCSE